jgi:hypothetical protein
MDGANIEIAAEIDRENMFIFGAEAHEVPGLRAARRSKPPTAYCPELVRVMDDLAAGVYGPMDEVAPILHSLKWENDYYLVSHDFPAYLRAQEAVDEVYRNPSEWTRRSILSTAGMGKFSTDRTIEEYARDIWHITPARRLAPVSDAMGRARSFPSLVAAADGGAAAGASSGAPLKGAGASSGGLGAGGHAAASSSPAGGSQQHGGGQHNRLHHGNGAAAHTGSNGAARP